MSSSVDYGFGSTNIDRETGIRYGVIPVHEILQCWCDSSEASYGPPTCPECGREFCLHDEDCPLCALESGLFCEDCQKTFSEDDVTPDPAYYRVDDGEYTATQEANDTDIFVIKSPYYTLCRFCSPCAPGAGYLLNPIDGGVKTYCFGHDWFDEKAPYPVYRVSDGSVVEYEDKSGIASLKDSVS